MKLSNSKNKRIERKFLNNGTIVYRRNDGIISKLAPRWLGPYKIFDHDERGNYFLQDETGSGLTQKYPIEKLKIVAKEVFDQNVGEVECILNDRTKNNKVEYLIRWKENKKHEWINEDRFETVDIINKYWKEKHSSKNKDGEVKKRGRPRIIKDYLITIIIIISFFLVNV